MRVPLATRIGAELGHCIAFCRPPQPEVADDWCLPREMQNARSSADLKTLDRKAGRGQTECDGAFDGNGDLARLRAALPVASGDLSGVARAAADASGWGKISPPMRRPGGSTAQ